MSHTDTLWRLAKGETVGVFDASVLPPAARAACADGARALGTLHKVTALLEPKSGRREPSSAAPEVAQPATGGFGTGKRWSVDEDTRLREAMAAGTSLASIAEAHHRSVPAIALRLVKPLGLWSQEQADAVIAEWKAVHSANPAPAVAAAPATDPVSAADVAAAGAPSEPPAPAELSAADEDYIRAVLAKKGKAPLELLVNHVRGTTKCSPAARDRLLRELGAAA